MNTLLSACLLICLQTLSVSAQDTAQNVGLEMLYTATGGPHWSWQVNDTQWVFEDGVVHDPCAEGWAGVVCNGTDAYTVTSIKLVSYNLTGTLPPSYSGLEKLTLLDIGYNSIGGVLPEAFGSLVNIEYIHIGINSLEGLFPECMNTLSNIIMIDVIGNKLSGPMPPFTASIDTMANIYVGENELTGVIPDSIASMSNLEYLYLTKNKFNGTIPYELGSNLPNLYYLGLSTNSFTGYLPESVGSLQQLRYLMLNGNHLVGTIPPELGLLTNLMFFEVNFNDFTGPVPEAMGNMENMFAIEICDNYINGTIPSSLGKLSGLDTLYLDNNDISGPIPSEFGKLVNLTGLLLYKNRISGRIPTELGNLSRLTELSLYKNRLSGLIPESITNLPSLVQLVLQKNRLTGFECIALHADECEFNMPCLQRLDVSDNGLEGPLPMQIFRLPALRSVALVNGCFHGEIGDDVCLATNLEVLSLDGLTSGPECRQDKTFHPFAFDSGYIVKHYMTGSLPECVWHMPNLTVLHIAGNGLTGTLPSIDWPSKLINVSVAYNKISGTLPNGLQVYPFVELCVAYNKISGVLSTNLQHYLPSTVNRRQITDSTHTISGNSKSRDLTDTKISAMEYSDYESMIGSVVSVEVNRLSGYVPMDFEKVDTLAALNGNFFMCTSDHPLPDNDEQSDYYICGSKNLDQSIAVWAVVIAVIIVFSTVLVSVMRSREKQSNLASIDGGSSGSRKKRFGDSRGSILVAASKQTPTTDATIAAMAYTGSEYDDTTINTTTTRDSTYSEYSDGISYSEHTRSLHTAAGSFDGHMAHDSLLDDSSSNMDSGGGGGKQYQYYSRYPVVNNVCGYSYKVYRNIVYYVLLWIEWFEETMIFDTASTVTATRNSVGNDGLNMKDLKIFISLLCMIRRSAMLITGIIVLVCVPMYLLLKLVWGEKYSTHTHQYGWLVSAAFLSGIVPAALLLVVYLALCCVLAYSLVMLYPRSSGDAHHYVRMSMLSFPRDSEHINLTLQQALITGSGNNSGVYSSSTALTDNGSKGDTPQNSFNRSSYFNLMRGSGSRSTFLSNNDGMTGQSLITWQGTKQLIVFASIFILNVIATLSVYCLYVYAFDTSTHYYVKVSMKVVLALFQISWNLIAVPKTVEYVAHLVSDSSSRVKWLITLCLSFNYIIAPATGALLSSSTCFKDYFTEQLSVVSFYQYDICRAYSLDISSNTRFCTEMTTASFDTSFVPPFMYNYQCSSSLITTYVAVLMLEHAIITLGPVTMVWLLSYKSAAKYVPNWFIRSIPSIVWPPQHRPPLTQAPGFRGAVMRPDRVIATFLSHFVVLITYGLADPFLAVTICIATCSLSLLAQILIGRYMYHYRLEKNKETAVRVDEGLVETVGGNADAGNITVVVDDKSANSSANAAGRVEQALQPLMSLNEMCSGILDGLPSCLWTIIFIGSFFMSAIIADMASDKVTWEIGIFIGLPAFLGPILAFVTLKYTLYASYK